MSNLPIRRAPSPAHRTVIAAINNLIDDLAQQADSLATRGDLHSLADGLHGIRGVKRAFSDLERHVENLVADTMTQDIVNLDDEVILERRRGKDRKQWQSEEILKSLYARSAADENGEVVDPYVWLDRFYNAVKACVPLTGSLSWRSGALREHGIDPDQWADVQPGRVSVKVEVREDQ